MDKQQILKEIKRLAADNSGQAPGKQAFLSATGVRESDWFPHIWLRWSDALAEAGYAPNEFQVRTSDEVLIEKYIALMRELGRFPITGEILRKAKEDKSFPGEKTFRRFGGKDKLLQAVAEYCRNTPEFKDVLALCIEHENASASATAEKTKRESKVATGFVYLMKSGPHYKIGFTNSLGRRGSELAIQIPIPPKTIHSIETDDPVGVEAYWHEQFKDKRRGGSGPRNSEWFDLSLEDVKAFKRWKRIS